MTHDKSNHSKLGFGTISVFLFSVGILLLITAIGKALSSFSGPPILAYHDDLLPIPNWFVLQLATGVEVAVIILLLSRCSISIKLSAIAWLGALFLSYRLGLWLTDNPRPCACLGSLTARIPLSEQAISHLMLSFCIYMTLGSTALLFLQRRSRLRVAAVAPMVVLFLMVSGPAEAQETNSAVPAFSVTGTIETTVYDQGVKKQQYVRPFTVAVDGCRFLVHSDPAEIDERIAYTEFGCDGTNGYLFAKHVTKATENDGTLRIFERECPPPNSQSTITPWMAFGSACYFNRRSNEMVHGLLPPRDERMAKHYARMRLRAAWTMDVSGFLASFTDYRSGSIVDHNNEEIALPAEYADGNSNSTYRVIAWTNVAGVRYPLEFTLTSFGPSPNNPTPPLTLLRRGRVKSLSAGAKRASYIPELSASVGVIDSRVQSAEGFTKEYMTRDKRILTPAELVTRLETAESSQAKRAFPKRKLLALSILGTVLLIPAIFVIGRIRRRGER